MIAGYAVSKVGGVCAATRLSAHDADETIVTVPVDREAAMRSVALCILADAGHVATLEQADAFVAGFLGELSTARYGVRTLRTSVVEDWIAAQRRAA